MKECNDLVSIIVPVYGTESYLPACIDSICTQTYKNIQIILVDDQSPDSCPEICDAYAQKDNRIIVIHQQNKGVSGARNTGICYSTGDYIMFVDSDDELCPDAVDSLLRDAKQYGADVASGTRVLVDGKGNVDASCADGSVTTFCDDEPLLLALKGDPNTESVWAKLFKFDFIKGMRFVEGKKIHEDGFFIFQCYMKKPLLIQRNVSVYRYNIREESASRQVFSDKYLSMLYFFGRKKAVIAAAYPQYMDHVYNMELRTNLQLLQVLCSSTDKKYKELQKQCIRTVRRLKAYHRPANNHFRKLERIVTHGLYPIYKFAVRMKYYR